LGSSIGAGLTKSLKKKGPKGSKTYITEYDIDVQEHVEALKCTPKPLRVSGIEEPTLEVSLLMDCTSSMQSWIDRAKETLIQIIDKVVKDCEEDGQLKVRISFVGYRDIKDKNRFTILPFTDDIQSVKAFINNSHASGGNDIPEDMQGGLKLCLLQDWTEEASKRVIIITDAPPHGTRYHDTSDDFPEGSPDGIELESLMQEFAQKEIEF